MAVNVANDLHRAGRDDLPWPNDDQYRTDVNRLTHGPIDTTVPYTLDLNRLQPVTFP